MPSLMRPTRPEVSDRFSLMGFTIRTGRNPWFEVALATRPELLTAEGKARRNPQNFFSTHGIGPLPAERGEAVYLVPPQVLRRFVGNEKIYYTVASFPSRDRTNADVAPFSADTAPWVRVSKSFTGRALRQMIGVPNANGGLAGDSAYGGPNGASLEWVGDAARPGAENLAPPRRTDGAAVSASYGDAFIYDDGLGPWPEESSTMNVQKNGVQKSNGNGNGHVHATSYGASPELARAQTAAVIVPIVSTIVGTIMTRILNNEGDIKWELDQLKGLKYPGDDKTNVGPTSFTTATIDVKGWPYVENLLGDRISADFEIRYQHNGRSVGNIEISNIGTNDAVGWGLEVKATIMDDQNTYPSGSAPATGHAAVKVRFYYRFTRAIGSDWIAITDYVLYADGTVAKSPRWTQTGAERAIVRAAEEPSTAVKAGSGVGTAIAGAVLTRILNNSGDITWSLDQLSGIKYPGDDKSNTGTGAYSNGTIAVKDWPYVENLLGDRISADFEVKFQYNGRAVGNVQISNTGTNDAVGWGLEVKATINDDSNVYPSGATHATGYAALRVRFYYRFSRSIGSDWIAITDYTIYANGTFAKTPRWIQTALASVEKEPEGVMPPRPAPRTLALAVAALDDANAGTDPTQHKPLPPPPLDDQEPRVLAPRADQMRSQGRRGSAIARPQAGPAIAGEIVGAVITRILGNEGDVKWELEQMKGLKYPWDDKAHAGSSIFKRQTRKVGGMWIENGFTDRITADFEIAWDYNGRSLGNVEITTVGTNDAVGWGLEVKGTINNDPNAYTMTGFPDAFAVIRVQLHYVFTRAIGSDSIAVQNIELYGNGKSSLVSRWTQ